MSAENVSPDRNLALELVRVTEAAALAAARWVGRKRPLEIGIDGLERGIARRSKRIVAPRRLGLRLQPRTHDMQGRETAVRLLATRCPHRHQRRQGVQAALGEAHRPMQALRRFAEPGEMSLGDGVALVRRLLAEATTPPRWPMYPRQFKQFLRTAQPDFDERKYGSIADLMRACQKDGLLRLERDRQGALRVFASGGAPRASAEQAGWGPAGLLDERRRGELAHRRAPPGLRAVRGRAGPDRRAG